MVVRYTRDALKFLSRQDKKTIARIREAITGLTKTPPQGDIKSMQGYSDGRKRLRVGQWRIIYQNTQDGHVEVLLILDIGNRGDIYK